MAARESNRVDIKNEELDDMTRCCICSDVYTNPKDLPCLHTFCMECLQQTGLKTNNGPGEEMPCPICRQQFKIPPEGFRGLPENFFIEKLIQMANISDKGSPSRAVCMLCLKENKKEVNEGIPIADTYCVDCKQQLCAECCSEHRKFKLTKNHKLVPITEHEGDQTAMADPVAKVCEQHEKKVLDVYCANCKAVLCAICFIDDHKNHEGSHVNKFFDGFRKEIENKVEAINECISQAQMKRTELMKVEEEMQERVQHLEYDVANRKEEIRQITDKHANSLLEYISSEKESKLKEIKMSADDIDAYLSDLESFKIYCRKISVKGSASDVCRAVSDISSRAVELQQHCQPIIERGIQSFNFCFGKSELEEFLVEGCGNLIGEIKEEGDSKQNKRSRQSRITELRNEIDRLREEIKIEKRDKENLLLEVEQLKTNVNKEAQAFTEELNKEKANHNAHLEKLKQEQDKNKIANNTLQANNDSLQQLLDAENKIKILLHANNDKLLQDVDHLKTTLESSDEKLRQELKTITTDKKEKILVLEQTQEQQRKTWMEEKKKLMEQIVELRRNLDPALVQTIRTKASEEGHNMICGLAILDNELFVTSQGRSKVEVYDLMTFSLSRRWDAQRLFCSVDIGSCNRNKCLYILDYKQYIFSYNEILRVDPGGKLIKKWSTGYEYGYNLSVTNESTVILTIHNKNKLNEYSADGKLIREINLSLDAGNRYLLHALQMTNGNFVVSYGGDPLMVSVMDGLGEKKKLHFGEPGSAAGQMHSSVHLAVDGNGFVMVADQMNSRVLILDSDLNIKKEILSKSKRGIRQPVRILLDESNGRLFVADNERNNPRILIFDFKTVYLS